MVSFLMDIKSPPLFEKRNEKKSIRIFLIILSIVVLILLIEGVIYHRYRLIKKENVLQNSSQEIKKKLVGEIKPQNLAEEFPRDKETGIGVTLLSDNQVNIWGSLVSIEENKLVLDVNRGTLEIFLDETTIYNTRPKEISPPVNYDQVVKKVSKQELSVGQEIEVVANLEDTGVLNARIVAVLK